MFSVRRLAPSSRLSLWLLALAVSAGVLSACANNPGIDPTTDRLFFPTGLALDPKDAVLYVTNGNVDIRYNGGTLSAIDLEEFHCRRFSFQDENDPRACPGTCNG